MPAQSRTTARKVKAEPLTLADRCALSYAARVLYTIPVQQWSNALDMVDMIEGKPCGRGGYILGQARAIWHASTWPQENYFASELQLEQFSGPDTVAHWEKYIAQNVAVVKAAEAKDEADIAAKEAAKVVPFKPAT